MESARQELFHAAATVVAEHGYAKASISKITSEAGLAQGTFYLYFDSRQQILNELLPFIGEEILGFIGERTRSATDFYDMEERGLRAYFEYLNKNPGFVRILNEAEVAAPLAHEVHFSKLTEKYVNSMSYWVERGEIGNFSKSELEPLVYIFMSARSYLYLLYRRGKDDGLDRFEQIVGTYMKIVRDGVK